jgi:uncharacterized membrane protein YphA (DoxX/SURF4 family)
MTPLTRWILSIALAYVLIVFGVDKLLNPPNWIGWMPLWMDGLLGINVNAWLTIIGVLELLLGIGVLIHWKSLNRIAAFFASVHLLGIIVVVASFSGSLWNDQILVRDIGLFAISLVLIF